MRIPSVRPEKSGRAKDHRHRMHRVAPYDDSTVDDVVTAFWNEVESVMKEKGVWQ